MKLKKKNSTENATLQIAPLIDVVFLLLIYFMVTASLIKKEGDIFFVLPATVNQDKPVDIPVEAVIEVYADGTVELEGLRFSVEDSTLQELAGQLRSLKSVASSQQSVFFVTVQPHRHALHYRIIEVLDACAAAKVDSLTFGQSF